MAYLLSQCPIQICIKISVNFSLKPEQHLFRAKNTTIEIRQVHFFFSFSFSFSLELGLSDHLTEVTIDPLEPVLPLLPPPRSSPSSSLPLLADGRNDEA